MRTDFKSLLFSRTLCLGLCLLIAIGQGPVYAQTLFINSLPPPGDMLSLSADFTPVVLRGVVVHPDKPLNFDFVIDAGNHTTDPKILRTEGERMVKYFLAALTVPSKDLWVNLSPYEHERIISKELGDTELGRDMLAQDYVLKQLTASLIYPERGLGKKFWDKVYDQARTRYGVTNIPMQTFNKVWITPASAEIYEKDNTVYVTKARLKVKLDEDFRSLTRNKINTTGAHALTPQVLRQVIIPALEKEVNEGKNFASLRQIYHATILAKWYRQAITKSLLSRFYIDKNKIKGIDLDDKTIKEQIYERYIRAYKKGVFNYIKETPMPNGQLAPRKYFSGGISQLDQIPFDHAQTVEIPTQPHFVMNVELDAPAIANPAMTPDLNFAMTSFWDDFALDRPVDSLVQGILYMESRLIPGPHYEMEWGMRQRIIDALGILNQRLKKKGGKRTVDFLKALLRENSPVYEKNPDVQETIGRVLVFLDQEAGKQVTEDHRLLKEALQIIYPNLPKKSIDQIYGNLEREDSQVSENDMKIYTLFKNRKSDLLLRNQFVLDRIFSLPGEELENLIKNFKEIDSLFAHSGLVDPLGEYVQLAYLMEMILPDVAVNYLKGLYFKNGGIKVVMRFLDSKRSFLLNDGAWMELRKLLRKMKELNGKSRTYKLDTNFYKMLNLASAFLDLGGPEKLSAALESVVPSKNQIDVAKQMESILLKQMAEFLNITSISIKPNIQEKLYMPYLSRIRVALKYIKDEKPWKLDRFKALIRATLEDRFWNFIEDESQSDEEGAEIAQHNKGVRKALAKVGINVDRWLGKQLESRLPEERFTFGQNSFIIRPIFRRPGYDVFLGDFTNCSVGMSSNQYPDGMMERLIDEGLNTIEVIDESTQKPTAAAWLFVAEDGSVVIQNLEANTNYESDPSLKNYLGEQMVAYTMKFANHVGTNLLLIGDAVHGKYWEQRGKAGFVIDHYGKNKVKFGLEKIGGYLGEKYYLTSAGEEYAYLVTDFAMYVEKVSAMQAVSKAASPAMVVFEGAQKITPEEMEGDSKILSTYLKKENMGDVDEAMKSKETQLTQIIRENITGNVSITLNELAVEAGFDDPANKTFQRVLLKYLQTIPKTILHEHVSGVIFPEDLIRYFLDDEPSKEEFTADERQNRLEARREARRRFVLTVDSRRSGIDLQANPVNPNNSQEEADRAFREILELPQKVPLTLNDINLPNTVKKLKIFVTYKDKNVDWNNFERAFAVIKTVTDAHPRFRYELLREGVLRHFNQDNVRNLELTDFHSQSLGELLKELVSIEQQLHGAMTLSVLKAFRKDYLERVLKQAEKNEDYRQEVFKRYQGQSLDEVKESIFRETLKMDQQYFKLDREKIKKEFEEAIEQIKENLNIEKKEQVTLEDLRNRLIFALEARKLALKEAKDFETDLNRLELNEPLLRKRIGGISSIGNETGYINWVGSPILRNARRIGLKISSHMGEVWEPSQYVTSLKRIKYEIENGVNRLAHVTVLGLDYGPSTRIPISEPERIDAQKLQEEIFSLLLRNNIHIELQPTSQIITSADFNDYKGHIIRKFFKMNKNGSGLSFSINPDDSSIFDTSSSQEELAVWLANPELPYSVLSQTFLMANDARFYESPRRVKRRLRNERRKVWAAIKGFNKPIQRPAIVVIGSARIPDGGPQEETGREIGKLAWENSTAIKTGGGPAAMKWPLEEFIKSREDRFRALRKRGLSIPDNVPVQSINVLVNTFEPENKSLEQNYMFRHFVFRKLGLHLNALGLIGIHGGLGTWDEIFEGWRRRREISLIGESYYKPILDVLKDRWEFAGLLDRVDYWPFVTNSSEEAFYHILDHADKHRVIIPTQKQTMAVIKEMENGIDKLSALPRAVVILGKPEDNAYGRTVLNQLNGIISPIFKMKVPVRIASRGIILGSVLKQAQQLRAESVLQAVLYKKEEVEGLVPSEQYVKQHLPGQTLFLEDDSNHQLLLTYDARGYIVLPGVVGIFNKLFDIVVAMQTGSIRRKPIILVGREFWEPILKILKQTMENYDPPLVSKGDFELMTIIDTPQEATEELALNGIGERTDAAMMGTGNRAMNDTIHTGRKQDFGGIDLQADKINLHRQNDGQEINVHADPAMIEQFQNAPGFVPVIINIRPLTDIRMFLGINKDQTHPKTG